MTSRRGFTLVEVLAAVLVLGLLYTVLANAAMRGLRSEGLDRRRADAEMIADREMTSIESDLSNGVPLTDGLVEREEEPYKVISNVEPFDVFAALPAALHNEIRRGTDPKAPSLLHDERGQSRMRRISVVVAWDEAGEPDHVERTTFAFDRSALEQYFPPSDGAAEGTPEAELEKVYQAVPPELKQSTLDAYRAAGGRKRVGPSPPPEGRSGRSGRTR